MRKRHRIKLLAILVVLAGIAAFSAYSYFSGSGQGSQTFAISDTGPAGLVLDIEPIVGELRPDTSLTVSFRPRNTGTERIYFSEIRTDTAMGEQGISGLPPGCLRSWFEIPSPPDSGIWFTYAPGTFLDPGQAGTFRTVQLKMLETGSPQDQCLAANPTVHGLVH